MVGRSILRVVGKVLYRESGFRKAEDMEMYMTIAREKQVTTNAEAAYVAAQALATEYYGKTAKGDVTADLAKTYILGTDNGYSNIERLTDIQEDFTVDITMKDETNTSSKDIRLL